MKTTRVAVIFLLGILLAVAFPYYSLGDFDYYNSSTSITWEFPHGITEYPLAVFSRHYDGATVALADLLPEDVPPELSVVWYYDEAALVPAWLWFTPGWPESTLQTLEYCHLYDIVVIDGCTWTIPQTEPPPEPTPTPEDCTLSFPHGINDYQTAVFKRHYYCEEPLDLSDASPPAQLNVVWYYDESDPNTGWLWFSPGWPESTLETLVYCHIYDFIVIGACTWEIPQPVPTPLPTVTMSCAVARDTIQPALTAYNAQHGEWPTADGQPGDIEWTKLVPDFMAGVPSNDSLCDWWVNSNPQGEVCVQNMC